MKSRKDFNNDIEMSPAHASVSMVGKQARKTIQIEIDSDLQTSEPNVDTNRPMSPAFKNNKNFRRAASKMPAVGNETKWPRRDNAFMVK